MEKRLNTARTIATLLDSQFKFGKVSFGVESFLGFIPFIGDVLGILLALYIYRVAIEMNVPRRHRLAMIINIVLDFLLGLIPFIGDIFDITFKANQRNVRILENHFQGKVIEGKILD